MDQTNCDGSQPDILASASCLVPISILRDSVYQQPWGSSISAKVIAYNLYGYSEESNVGNDAVILTNPDAPVNLVEIVASRTPTSISIDWQEGAANGGDTVDGYRVWYDQANDDFVILVPETNLLTHTEIDLTSG